MSVHPPPRAETSSEGPVPLATGHKPYVPDGEEMPELTWSAVAARARSSGIIFGASSLYLVLKVGMTVSASIPVAVLSITLFRGLSRAFGHPPAPRSSRTTSSRRPARPASRSPSASASRCRP